MMNCVYNKLMLNTGKDYSIILRQQGIISACSVNRRLKYISITIYGYLYNSLDAWLADRMGLLDVIDYPSQRWSRCLSMTVTHSRLVKNKGSFKYILYEFEWYVLFLQSNGYVFRMTAFQKQVSYFSKVGYVIEIPFSMISCLCMASGCTFKIVIYTL